MKAIYEVLKNLAKADEVKQDIDNLNEGLKETNNIINTKVAMLKDVQQLDLELRSYSDNLFMPIESCNSIFETYETKFTEVDKHL